MFENYVLGHKSRFSHFSKSGQDHFEMRGLIRFYWMWKWAYRLRAETAVLFDCSRYCEKGWWSVQNGHSVRFEFRQSWRLKYQKISINVKGFASSCDKDYQLHLLNHYVISTHRQIKPFHLLLKTCIIFALTLL